MKQQITQAATKWFESLGHNKQLQLVQSYAGVINSTEQIVSIWIQEVVMKWWSIISFADRYTLSNHLGNNKPHHLLSDDEIAAIYLKEHERKESKTELWVRFGKDYLSANIFATQQKHLRNKTLKERQDMIVIEMEKKGWDINWKKEQDKVLAAENKTLTEVLEKARQAIY